VDKKSLPLPFCQVESSVLLTQKRKVLAVFQMSSDNLCCTEVCEAVQEHPPLVFKTV